MQIAKGNPIRKFFFSFRSITAHYKNIQISLIEVCFGCCFRNSVRGGMKNKERKRQW